MLIRVSYGLLRCSNRAKEVNRDAATVVSCMKVSREEISLRRTERRGTNYYGQRLLKYIQNLTKTCAINKI